MPSAWETRTAHIFTLYYATVIQTLQGQGWIESAGNKKYSVSRAIRYAVLHVTIPLGLGHGLWGKLVLVAL